jgi:hypothetical protein
MRIAGRAACGRAAGSGAVPTARRLVAGELIAGIVPGNRLDLNSPAI